MRVVLVSGGNRLYPDDVVAFAKEVAAEDEGSGTVDLVTWAAPTRAVRAGCRQVIVLGPVAEASEGGGPTPAPEPPTGLSPARVRAAVGWRARKAKRFLGSKVRRSYSLLGRDRAKAWKRVRRDPAAMDLLRDAELVVALDAQAIRVGWEIARKQPETLSVWGLAAGRVTLGRITAARSQAGAEPAAEHPR